ncbi:hypothetical protein F2P79_011597 [Pimephales promelas]|nr:hypothetical protein F2P79_011597 [Pimephales promelas]
MNPPAPCREYRAGPVFHGQDENRTVPPESELEHTLRSPFLKRGTTTPVCHPRGTVPDRHAMLQRRVNQDSPTASRDLRYSGRISSTPGALPPRSFLTTSVTSARVMDEFTSEPSASASSMEDVTAGLRRSSKYSFHRPTTSPVEARVFASTTTRAAVRLACRYPSAASGVPRANQAR